LEGIAIFCPEAGGNFAEKARRIDEQRFTEGLDAPELQTAKSLLDTLQGPVGGSVFSP
jgi:hypothetical protein